MTNKSMLPSFPGEFKKPDDKVVERLGTDEVVSRLMNENALHREQIKAVLREFSLISFLECEGLSLLGGVKKLISSLEEKMKLQFEIKEKLKILKKKAVLSKNVEFSNEIDEILARLK